MASHGMALRGMSSHVMASHGMASHGMTSHGMTSHRISYRMTLHHRNVDFVMRCFYSKTTSVGVLNHYATNGGGHSEVTRSQPGQPPASGRSATEGTQSGPSPQKSRSSTDQSGQRSSTAAVVATDTLVSSPRHNATPTTPSPTHPQFPSFHYST